ncbi:hypothetical protein ACFL21_00790 [Patescibacteria group bacterium]
MQEGQQPILKPETSSGGSSIVVIVLIIILIGVSGFTIWNYLQTSKSIEKLETEKTDLEQKLESAVQEAKNYEDTLEKMEKETFILATLEATCHIFEAENIFDPALEQETREIYKKWGFDSENDEEMERITEKYENDEDVQKRIMEELEECGGDLFSELEEAN